jgi:cystathionine gamma-synthase
MGETSQDSRIHGFDTDAVHGGTKRDSYHHALITPIVQSAVYTFDDTADVVDYQEEMLKDKLFERTEYGRYGNPTRLATEHRLAFLDGGECALLFATGMSATVTAFLTLLSGGDHLIITSDCYRRTRGFCENFLSRFGVDVSVIDPGDYETMETSIRETTRLIFSESPTNPYLRVLDVHRAVKIAQRHGLLTVVDSTLATPYNQRPLEMGVDLVIHSATKYLGGHNDLLAGVVVGSRELLRQIKDTQGTMGGVIGPQDAYLLLRGLKTLGLRMERQNRSGMEIAAYLESHPKVQRVFYPGLVSHPDYGVASSQMTGFGGMVSFEVHGGLKAASAVVDRLRLPQVGPSFGGTESLIIQPALQSYYELTWEQRQAVGIKDELLRYAAGLEDPADLIADLAQALDTI